MMAAALPVSESRRQEALQSYEVLDTPEEAAFDELVQLASHETPRELAFCAHAILHPDQVLQVPDAQQEREAQRNRQLARAVGQSPVQVCPPCSS